MSSILRNVCMGLAVGSLICATTGLSEAQESQFPGYVRVSDGPARIEPQAGPSTQGPIVQANCQSGQCNMGGGYSTGCPCPNCQSGNCPQYGYGACPSGCFNCQHTQHIHAFLDWFNPHGACTHSPDHGYNPPIKSPIFRRGVAYTKYFPDAWMGIQSPDASGMQRAPLVYMPTDTTQLGYYYQHAPRWMPVRGMVPPAPIPNQWHYTCQDQWAGACPNGTCPQNGGEVYQGQVIDAGQGVPGNVIEVQPNAAPIESVVPPAPAVEPPAAAPQAPPAVPVEKAGL